jgi:hypothetical protein
MSKPEIKRIRNIEEADDDEDACVFYIQYDKDCTQIMLTIQSKRSMTPEEYIEAVSEFVNNVTENPESLFVDDPIVDEAYH